MKLLNCAAGDPLGYPAFYRAVYSRFAIAGADRFADTVSAIVGAVSSSGLGLVINDPTPLTENRAAVVRVEVLEQSAGVTVAHLANALAVPHFALVFGNWGYTFVSLERISESVARDNATDKPIADATDADPLTNIAHILDAILALVIIGLLVWGALKVRRLARNV